MTDADFDSLSWHDCHIWGLHFRVGDADAGDWTSDLVLDIDFIVEWICRVGGGADFRVAPGIRLHSPQAGEITFGAVGFTQTLAAEPVLTNKQHLSLDERRRLTAQ